MYWPQAVLARPLPESRTLAVPDRFLVIARDASRPPGISLSRGLLQPLEKPDQVRELERGQRAGQALDRLMCGGKPESEWERMGLPTHWDPGNAAGPQHPMLAVKSICFSPTHGADPPAIPLWPKALDASGFRLACPRAIPTAK